MAQHGMASIAIEYRMMNIFSCSFVKAGYCADVYKRQTDSFDRYAAGISKQLTE